MKKALLFFLSFFFITNLAAPQSPPPTIQVILYEGRSIRIGSGAPFTIGGKTFPSGDLPVDLENGMLRVENEMFGAKTIVEPSSPLAYLTVNGKPYRGRFLLSIIGNLIRVVNDVGIEEYLYGVIPKEMPGADLEALKAQAVASRTLAVNAMLRSREIRATVSQQVYGGVEAEKAITNQAVDDTRGMVLTFRGHLVASPLFSSTCGGRTESNRDVFGKAVPYLVSVLDTDTVVEDPYCTPSPYFHWTVTWTSEQLMDNLQPYGVHGKLLDLIPMETDAADHVKMLLVRTTEGDWRFRGFAIRKILMRPDRRLLYSTWFTLTKTVDNGQWSFTADGRGEGHSVGLCQWGAIGMARRGKDYRDILAHYYQGTSLEVGNQFSFGAKDLEMPTILPK